MNNISLKLLFAKAKWKPGQEFVGRGGGSHIWEVLKETDDNIYLCKSLRTKELNHFIGYHMVPVELCDTKVTHL